MFCQSVPCPYVDAGPDHTFDCSQSCTNLNALFLDIRETSSYTVEALQYTTPISYDQIGGNQVSANTDDVWSSIINLPFTFCYYGQTFTTCKIGSNGAILFGPSTNGGSHPWSFTASLTNSTGINGAGHVLGIYHDIDPSVCGTIKWYVVGNAPCRQFVVSYNQVCHFSCTTITSSHMMVLNETTNYIDVYVDTKPLCTTWNGGRAVIGLQNISQNGGITAPNRNTNPTWSVSNSEAWRFKPAGNPLYTFQWLQGTTSLGSSSTINVCPTQATTYTAQFVYTPCGSSNPVTLTDNVSVTPAPGAMLVTSVIEPSLCGQSNGAVTLSASGGSGNFQYSSDNLNFSTSNTFSGLSSGQYMFYIQDDNGCFITYPLNVNDSSSLVANINSVSNVNCAGGSNGSIDIFASGGTPAYSYLLGTGTSQSSGIFTGLTQGNYHLTVTDAQGCTYHLDTLITEPNVLSLTQIVIDTSICNLPNGLLEVSGIGGTGSLSFSIDNFITQQASGLFDSLYSNSYLVSVHDENSCQDTLTVFVPSDSSVQANLIAVNNISCNGLNDGTLTIGASLGPLPYSFSLNNGPIQSFSEFSNLSSGQYTVTVSDANGCKDSVVVNIMEPTALDVNVMQPNIICEGDTISLLAIITGGTGPYTSIWNGNIFGNPAIVFPTSTTSYNLEVTDSNGCLATDQISATVLPMPVAYVVYSPQSGYAPLNVVFSNQSTNASLFDWNFGNGQMITTSDLNTTNTNYGIEGTYAIQLIASNGYCFDIWMDTIVVDPYVKLEVEVPNVFSPNSDGTNEGYYVYTKNATAIDAVIVDRWGVKMVEITDLNYKWDGKTLTGKNASEGVYFIKYKISGVNNQESNGQTFFHLIR